MTDLIARLREEAFVRREYYPETAALLEKAAAELERLVTANEHWHVRIEQLKTENERLSAKLPCGHPKELDDSYGGCVLCGFRDGYHQYENEIEALRAHPALTSWDSPDALRTRIVALQQPPYSPTDSIDSVQEKLT